MGNCNRSGTVAANELWNPGDPDSVKGHSIPRRTRPVKVTIRHQPALTLAVVRVAATEQIASDRGLVSLLQTGPDNVHAVGARLGSRSVQ
jgi:hypothetical protein